MAGNDATRRERRAAEQPDHRSSEDAILPAAVLTEAVPVETVEVRWWHPGALPRSVLDVLSGAAVSRKAEVERRVDTYFRQCGDGLAVKIRESAAIEIKQRRGAPEVAELAPGVVGRVERWTKWSLPCCAPNREGSDPGPDGVERTVEVARAWVPVAKTRWLLEESGVSVELAEVRTPDHIHWTCALEAPAGDPGDLGGATTAIGLERHAGYFTLDASSSYASWIDGPDGSS